MTIDDALVQTAFSSFGFIETVAMLIGGVLAGAFIMYQHPAIQGGTPIVYVCILLVLLGLVFFVSRGAALYFDASHLWPRNVGFSLLWVIYCASMGVGVAARRRLT